ncbi:MAG: 4Fe-4S dicluster domain-containing protein [Candidatus Omnitrophica bacterium]|nr:4Fe-4S dicluster domain-containing protein [Candidatus Omnitrophota bacterium]
MPMFSLTECFILSQKSFPRLFEVLQAKGYQVIGPTVRDGAVVYEQLSSVDELPCGWQDDQGGGTYRLKRRADNALFGYGVGPHSWKKLLHLPAYCLWSAQTENGKLQIAPGDGPAPKLAFLGVRSCELHALAIQDKVFLRGKYVDPAYRQRRENALIVAVNCAQPSGTCFCVSMNTGPKASFSFDLALTEVIESGQHFFLVETGSPQGAELLGQITEQKATQKDKDAAARVVANAAAHMGRTMESAGIKDLLYRNYDHPRWEDVAARCLSCANCTMVCPTCFCTTVEDATDLAGKQASRWRKWDSCFTMDFSFIHGSSVRASTKSRYRQWMTHKLATWFDQFGTSGCVGCGRCISWCPVGIDITEEARVIRQNDGITLTKEQVHENQKP